MLIDFSTGKQLADIARELSLPMGKVVIKYQSQFQDSSEDDVISDMKNIIDVMRQSYTEGLSEDIKSISGLIGGEGKLLHKRYKEKESICGSTITLAVSRALAVTEVNAAMGRIVAAPTAGSCGIIPGAVITVAEHKNIPEEKLIEAMFTASGIGMIIANNATLSGAEGGCQAECGSASAMAAAAIVELLGGNGDMALDAAAIALKNVLGLVCDPIAGLVEAPCSKRNAMGTVNALISSDMSLAGIRSLIPFDEVVDAMYKVGRMIPCALRETAMGGLAVTPTGKRLEKEIYKRQ